MLALFPKAALGRFLVSYDVPTDAQGQFQRALSALKRYWGRDLHCILQSVIETVGIVPAEAVYALALRYGGRAAIYAVSEARVSEEWGKPCARRAIGFFNEDPPLIEAEREYREPPLPLGFHSE